MTDQTAKAGLTMLQHCVAGRLRQISRVVTAHYDNVLRAYGLTANQLTMLSLLSVLGPTRQADLEPYLMMEQSTVSRNVARLVEHGWITKTRGDDKRAFPLSLTTKGERVLLSAQKGWNEAQAWATALLDQQSISHINRIAKKINQRIP